LLILKINRLVHPFYQYLSTLVDIFDDKFINIDAISKITDS
jgi:hypothetical protein